MLLSWTVALLIPIAADPADAAAAAYLQDVRPVLERRCFACHGAVHQKGGLRLDTTNAIRAGGDSGPAVVPQDPKISLLIKKVAEPDPKLRMPPEGEPLAETEIAALHAEMAKEEYYRQSKEQIAEGASRLKEWESQLAVAYQRWEELEQLAD